MAKAKQRAVLVTTAHRGVFFGYASKVDGKTIALSKARLCVYWSADRVGPAADITLRNITSVTEITPAAVKAWESGLARWCA
jgi:hypothetical protein